jgi:hypothetical protein
MEQLLRDMFYLKESACSSLSFFMQGNISPLAALRPALLLAAQCPRVAAQNRSALV